MVLQEMPTRKLMRTSYTLAQKGVPPNLFPVACEIQKKNGVQLISGGGTPRNKGREYMDCLVTDCLVTVMKDDIAKTVKEANFFSVLIDGSQPGKTGAEKELVYIRVLNEGKPVYLCVGLLQIDGDATAVNIKNAVDGTFSNLDLSSEWQEKLLCCTADGAAVNFGSRIGVLT
jgi:hypothetical protein